MIEKSKVVKEFNGFKLGAQVVIFEGSQRDVPVRATIRQLGLVGFLVKGRAMSYYWTEKERWWRVYGEGDESLPSISG